MVSVALCRLDEDFHSDQGRQVLRAILVVQDHVEEATMDRQSGAIVVDEAQIPELIHKMTDA